MVQKYIYVLKLYIFVLYQNIYGLKIYLSTKIIFIVLKNIYDLYGFFL